MRLMLLLVINTSTRDGLIFSEEGCRSMILRQDILDSVSVEFPSTWKELVSVDKKIQNATD